MKTKSDKQFLKECKKIMMKKKPSKNNDYVLDESIEKIGTFYL